MGINTKYIKKYIKAYKDINVRKGLIFSLDSKLFYEEEWLPIIDQCVPNIIENAYYISNYGKIYTTIKSPKYPNGGIMKPSYNAHGYQQINLLSKDHRKIGCKIARLVLLHFNFIPYSYLYEVDHIDGNKDNNTIWNLEWVTPQENVHRAIKNELRPLSCNANQSTLLSDEEARDLYNKSYSGIPYEILANEYNVSIDYILGLRNGSIRPYIKNTFYNRRHI